VEELLDAGAHSDLDAMRHSAAHVLAEAVKDLFPDAKLTINGGTPGVVTLVNDTATVVITVVNGPSTQNYSLRLYAKRGSTFTDARDGQLYRQLHFGSKIWMAQNLNYRNSDTATNPADTVGACYNSDNANCQSYGRLYSGAALTGVCPTGWSVPTQADWDSLYKATGSRSTPSILKSTTGWSNGSSNGTDGYGFGILPGGYINGSGTAAEVGYGALFWTSTADTTVGHNIDQYFKADEIFPDAVFATHLDHGDEEACYDCIDSGFYSSVMIDASHDPFDQNGAITKRVVDAAHKKGLSVEAELGMLGGVEEDIKVEEGNACLTKPEEAQDFVKKTGCDSLACAIGTSHGAFKFKGKQSLHFEVLRGIKALLPGFPLVMHGSSSVPKEEVDRINAAGGKIAGSMGVDINEYLPAAKLGVTKINIDTDGRLVWTRVHREFFRDKPQEFDFRPPGKIFIDEYAKFIASRNDKLGSSGQLEDLRASLKK